MSNPVRILGIAGSLRRESYNRAAVQLVPPDATLDIFELDGDPGFRKMLICEWPIALKGVRP